MEGSLEGAARVFAGEFTRSTAGIPDPSGDGPARVLTPGGAVCGRILVMGALTEIADSGGGIRCRLADPTGVFDIILPDNGKTELQESLRRIPIPSFMAVIGRSLLRDSTPRSACIRPESVQIVTRPMRDAWIVRTADGTLDRVTALADALSGKETDPALRAAIAQYRITLPDLQEIVTMVETALASVAVTPPAISQEEPAPVPDDRETLVAILKEMQGQKGMPVDELVAQAGLRGIPEDRAKAAIETMIRDDDCYQPQKGSVRLL